MTVETRIQFLSVRSRSSSLGSVKSSGLRRGWFNTHPLLGKIRRALKRPHDGPTPQLKGPSARPVRELPGLVRELPGKVRELPGKTQGKLN